jgi:hypothetical protein
VDGDRTEVSDSTKEAEREEAQAPHESDRPPTEEEEEETAEGAVDEDVRRHHQEMDERGANQRGEGRVS